MRSQTQLLQLLSVLGMSALFGCEIDLASDDLPSTNLTSEPLKDGGLFDRHSVDLGDALDYYLISLLDQNVDEMTDLAPEFIQDAHIDAEVIAADAHLDFSVDAEMMELDADIRLDPDLGCVSSPELCDRVDNDCDDAVDEGQACGELIYNYCRVSLVLSNRAAQPTAPPWVRFPVPDLDESCGLGDYITTSLCSGSTARANSGFRTLEITQNQIGQENWLAIAWECDPALGVSSGRVPLSAAEESVLSWAQESCHVALAYQDIGSTDRLVALDPASCPLSSSPQRTFDPRCIQTGSDNTYSALELEGQVNQDDHFGIAFYCLNSSDERDIASRIQERFAIFFGVDHRGAVNDGDPIWINLLNNLVDNSGLHRGAGSSPSSIFSVFQLSTLLSDNSQIGIATVLR